jgi:hypothetical protein
MKIAYIELDYHSECLNSFCHAFKDRQDHVEIYTITSIYKDLSHNNFINHFTWVLCDKNRSLFLKNNINTINKNDVVLLGTIEKSIPEFTALKFNIPIILRVHGGNFYFNRKHNFRLPNTLSGIVDAIHFLVKNILLNKELKLLDALTKRIKNISFTSEIISNHFRELLQNNPLNMVEHIPLEVFEPLYNQPKNNNTYTIAIPGSIDVMRRDYRQVLDALNEIKEKIKVPIEIYLLGKPIGYKGRQVAKTFQSFNHNKISVYTFDEEIQQSEFERIMKKTNLILSLIKPINQHYFYLEQVGLTKISGTVSDIIRYGKYGLVPDFYPIPETMKKVITSYTSKEDLADRLLNAINCNSWLSAEEAKSVFNEFSADAVYNKTMRTFEKIIQR